MIINRNEVFPKEQSNEICHDWRFIDLGSDIGAINRCSSFYRLYVLDAPKFFTDNMENSMIGLPWAF